MNGAQLVESTGIVDIWTALGGGEVRLRRGKAFWRDGDSWCISLDSEKGVFFDHRDGAGGGKLALIEAVKSCPRKEAIAWLAAMTGTTLDNVPLKEEDRERWRDDQHVKADAPHFASAARVMAEEALERLSPVDPDRRIYTRLIHQLDVAPEMEFRRWRDRDLRLTNALVHAGRRREERLQKLLAAYLAQEVHAA